MHRHHSRRQRSFYIIKTIAHDCPLLKLSEWVALQAHTSNGLWPLPNRVDAADRQVPCIYGTIQLLQANPTIPVPVSCMGEIQNVVTFQQTFFKRQNFYTDICYELINSLNEFCQ